MGGKVNPNVIRFSKTNDWSSKYIEKKSSELYFRTAKDLEIKKFVYRFLKNNGLTVHNCKINYSDSELQLFITYQQSVRSAFMIRSINKTQKIKVKGAHSSGKRGNKKNHIRVLNSIKKNFNYESLSYKNDALRERKYSIKFPKVKRLKKIRYYKKYLSLNYDKTIKNAQSNAFLHKFFKGLTLFYPKSINVIFKSLNKNNIKKVNKNELKFLRDRLWGLKRFENNEFFKEGVNLIFSAVFNKNSADLISNFIALNLKKLKQHTFFLTFVTTLFSLFITKQFSNIVIKGIKIKIKGRLNGVPRSKRRILKIGQNTPILTLKSNISYAENTAYTANGTIGIKVWISEKTK